jgi:hypothetical protein
MILCFVGSHVQLQYCILCIMSIMVTASQRSDTQHERQHRAGYGWSTKLDSS